MKAKDYDLQSFRRLLSKNGYIYDHCTGSHFVYKKGSRSLVINKDVNRMVARRLIKEYGLEEK